MEMVRELSDILSALSLLRKIPLECKFYESYDDFIQGFPKDPIQTVIVARRGADGMECARNAKLMRPDIPIIWLSDDNGFGIESYRIGCAFFSADTLTEDLLIAALKRCEI